MKKLLIKLPNEIIHKIISYTYKKQKIELLEDIKHYVKYKSFIYIIYNKIYVNEYKDWLINDLLLYYNNETTTLFGFKPQFYNILFRNKLLQTTKQIHNYITLLEKKNIHIQINTLIGLLNIQEREQFLYNCVNV